jgi:hypothetical protein
MGREYRLKTEFDPGLTPSIFLEAQVFVEDPQDLRRKSPRLQQSFPGLKRSFKRWSLI